MKRKTPTVEPPEGSVNIVLGCYGATVEPVDHQHACSGTGSMHEGPFVAHVRGVSKNELAYIVGVEGLVAYFTPTQIIKALGVGRSVLALEDVKEEAILEKMDKAVARRLSRLVNDEDDED